MKIRNFLICLVVAGFVCAVAGSLKAQSLGDIARQQRAKQASQPKAAKVFTNDDMPKSTSLRPADSGAAGESASETAAKPAEGEANAESGEKKAGETNPDDKKKTKEYWQEQFKSAKADLDKAQEESTLADDELSLAQADAARQIDSDKRETADKNVATKQTSVDEKHAALDKAKQAMEDLKKQFEESGAPADWLPEEAK
ncbi:MAG: hypothetical protein ACM3NO_05285 [Deltaproteobacteria bacterium]